jgi:hypothetical protein
MPSTQDERILHRLSDDRSSLTLTSCAHADWEVGRCGFPAGPKACVVVASFARDTARVAQLSRTENTLLALEQRVQHGRLEDPAKIRRAVRPNLERSVGRNWGWLDGH